MTGHGDVGEPGQDGGNPPLRDVSRRLWEEHDAAAASSAAAKMEASPLIQVEDRDGNGLVLQEDGRLRSLDGEHISRPLEPEVVRTAHALLQAYQQRTPPALAEPVSPTSLQVNAYFLSDHITQIGRALREAEITSWIIEPTAGQGYRLRAASDVWEAPHLIQVEDQAGNGLVLLINGLLHTHDGRYITELWSRQAVRTAHALLQAYQQRTPPALAEPVSPTSLGISIDSLSAHITQIEQALQEARITSWIIEPTARQGYRLRAASDVWEAPPLIQVEDGAGNGLVLLTNGVLHTHDGVYITALQSQEAVQTAHALLASYQQRVPGDLAEPISPTSLGISTDLLSAHITQILRALREAGISSWIIETTYDQGHRLRAVSDVR